MPQSAEHLAAIDALGVRHGLLAVTRADLADPGPARRPGAGRDRGHLARRRSRRWRSAARPAPGWTTLRAALDRLVATLPAPDPAAPVRLWVDRVFTVRGSGTVVTGTLGAGALRVGDELELVPDGRRRVGVRGLQSLGRPVEAAYGTARVAVNLRGVAGGRDRPGRRAGHARAPGRSTSTVDVRLAGTPAAELPAELVLHAGSAAVPVRIRPLGTDTARLVARRPLPLHVGDRALLRDPGRRAVPAGLTVLDVAPPALRRRGAAAARAVELSTAGRTIRTRRASCAGAGRCGAAQLRAMGVRAGSVPLAGDWLVDPGQADRWRAALAREVAAHAAAHPLEHGLPVEAARQRLGLPDVRLVAALLGGAGRDPDRPGPGSPGAGGPGRPGGDGAGAALTVRDGRVVSAVQPALPEPVRAAVEAIREELAESPYAAPEAHRLAELGLGRRELAAAIRAGALLRVADGIYLLPGADAGATALLAGLAQPFTLSEARRALGTTRRVAVPLLELLDAGGRTERLPDDRRRVRH